MECNNCNERITNLYNNSNNLFPNRIMFGHAYTPNQIINRVFVPEEGLKNGTIFPELVSPYEPCDSMDEIRYLRGGTR